MYKIVNAFWNILILCMVLILCYGLFGFHEVETFQIDATLTAKEMTDKYKSTPQYHFFWVDGDRAGGLRVGTQAYARYNEGDLIPIKVIVEEDIFGNSFEKYKFGD